MDISVIVPIYGTELYIEECLTSLFNQTKTENVEFILVNDCTKDRAMDIANKIISNYRYLSIKVINHDKNKGIAATRQTGVEVAKGEYLIQIDSDDWCDSTMLEELYKKAVKDSSDIIICDYYRNEGNREFYVRQAIGQNEYLTIEMLLNGKLLGYSWNKLIRKNLFTKNYINYTEHIDFAEDLIVNIKLLCNTNKISYLNEAYVHYRINDNSVSSNLLTKSLVEWAKAYKELYDFFLNRKMHLFSTIVKSKMIKFKFCRIREAKSRDEQTLFSKLYPEITDEILHFKGLPIHHRLALYLASTNNLFLANAIWLLVEFIKSEKKFPQFKIFRKM